MHGTSRLMDLRRTHRARHSRFPMQAAAIADRGFSRQEYHARAPPCTSVAMASPTRAALDSGAHQVLRFHCIRRIPLPFRRMLVPRIRMPRRMVRPRLSPAALQQADDELPAPLPEENSIWASTVAWASTLALSTTAVQVASAKSRQLVAAGIPRADTRAVKHLRHKLCFPCAGSFDPPRRESSFHFSTNAFSQAVKAAACAPTIGRIVRLRLPQFFPIPIQAPCQRARSKIQDRHLPAFPSSRQFRLRRQ